MISAKKLVKRLVKMRDNLEEGVPLTDNEMKDRDTLDEAIDLLAMVDDVVRGEW